MSDATNPILIGCFRRIAARVPGPVVADNLDEGHAPETVRRLRLLLGQPDPVPPVRPRTTLFD